MLSPFDLRLPLIALALLQAPGQDTSSPLGASSAGPGWSVSANPHPSGQLCVATLQDGATGDCLRASSTPVLGRLYPLSTELYVSPSGDVGMGTTLPTARLDVVGDFALSGAASLSGGAVVGGGLDVSGGVVVNGAPASGELAVVASGLDALYAHAPASGGYGVHGHSSGLGGIGVFGNGTGTGGYGLYGQASGSSGVGVRATGSGADGRGLYATFSSNVNAAGDAVEGIVTSTAGGSLTANRGLAGRVALGLGTGVWGEGNVAALSDGVRGTANGAGSYGVYAIGNSGADGLVGTSASGTAVRAQGDLTVTGVKNFAHPHPTDPSREIRFVCLEGNESGTYFRGRSRLIGGSVTIQVPEEFRQVSAPGDLTVQLTAVGASAGLWVESFDLNQVVVRGDRDVDFHYQVNGVRAGYEDYQVVRENRSFVPRVAGVPYGEHLSPRARETLVGSGVLNPDYTPNRATADRMGWELSEPVTPTPSEHAPESPVRGPGAPGATGR